MEWGQCISSNKTRKVSFHKFYVTFEFYSIEKCLYYITHKRKKNLSLTKIFRVLLYDRYSELSFKKRILNIFLQSIGWLTAHVIPPRIPPLSKSSPINFLFSRSDHICHSLITLRMFLGLPLHGLTIWWPMSDVAPYSRRPLSSITFILQATYKVASYLGALRHSGWILVTQGWKGRRMTDAPRWDETKEKHFYGLLLM